MTEEDCRCLQVNASALWVKIITMHVPDHQLDRVHPNTQPFILGDYVGDAPAVVGQLRAEVHPLSRRRLGHDVDVDLQEGGRVTDTH